MRGVSIGADISQAAAAAGYISGISSTVKTKRYLDSATSYAFSELALAFGIAIDTYAQMNPERMHHVYEWGDSYHDYSNVGNPGARLWYIMSSGSGGKRAVSFAFNPSRKPVPIHPELLEPGKTGKTVKEGVHIFTWKAPVMEYGTTVTISPELGEFLALPSGKPGEPIFTKKTIRSVPGRGGTMGMFTSFTLGWWRTSALDIFENDIKPRLERDIGDEAWLNRALSRSRRQKKITVGVAGEMEFRRGQQMAKQSLEQKSLNYISSAAIRREELYGE